MIEKTLPLALAVALALPALAQEERASAVERKTEASLMAYAAGYKAGFVCSALFNAGKSMEQIMEHELSGIYPVVADIVASLPFTVEQEARRVSVPWDETMPPRIAQWRPHLGCVDLPVGAGPEAAAAIPGVTIEGADFDPMVDDGAPWTRHAPVNGPSGNAVLDKALADAFAGVFGGAGRTTAVLVATPQAILAERYTEGFTPTTSQRTWSVAKSIAASVVGAAVHQGLVDVRAPAAIPEWRRPADPRGRITLENLLHMASGLDSNIAGNRTDRIYIGAGLVADNAATRSLEAVPGTRWKYANNDTMLTVRALRAAFADDDAFLRFPFEALLYRIGMTHTRPETDWHGDFILSSQVWTTARDLARLGVLHLQDGVWQGERLLAEGWVDYIATPAPSQPPRRGRDGNPRPGYGAQWWLFDGHEPALPADSFAAMGNRGQFLMVVPSRDLVIVRRGYDMAGGEGFRIDDFSAAVLAALAEG